MSGMFEKGTFITGCNYWASHAGTAMWRDWRPDVVDDDFTRLAAYGINVLRVFPLWPDCQSACCSPTPAPLWNTVSARSRLPTTKREARSSTGRLKHFEEMMALLGGEARPEAYCGACDRLDELQAVVPPALEGMNVLTV